MVFSLRKSKKQKRSNGRLSVSVKIKRTRISNGFSGKNPFILTRVMYLDIWNPRIVYDCSFVVD